MPDVKKLGFALLLIVGLGLLAACSSEPGKLAPPLVCTEQVNPDITIDIPIGEPLEDRNLDIAALSARDSLDKNVVSLQNYKETLGTTSVDLRAHLDGDIQANPIGTHWCAKLVRATVKVDWVTTIYLAQELVPGSCPDNAVRGHEARHVALDRDLLPMLKSSVEESIRNVAQTPVWGSFGDLAMQNLKANIQRAAQAAINNFQTQRNTMQLSIDTPEEYDRVAALCDKSAFPKIDGKMATGM